MNGEAAADLVRAEHRERIVMQPLRDGVDPAAGRVGVTVLIIVGKALLTG